MKAHTIVLNICLVISAGCLGGGYIMGGYWLVIPVFLVMSIFWITTRKQSAFWSASGLLLIYVALAAIGVMVNLSPPLMVLGCTTSLACWDLMHFRQSMVDIPPHESNMLLERYRLQSLATAVFTGLLLALLSWSINLQLPFGAIVFLVLLGVGCLTYGLRYRMKNH